MLPEMMTSRLPAPQRPLHRAVMRRCARLRAERERYELLYILHDDLDACHRALRLLKREIALAVSGY